MRSKYQVLVDSDAFVGWMLEDDAHHKRVVTAVSKLRQEHQVLVTTNFVVGETATVLSKLSGQSLARQFLDAVKAYPTIHITEALQNSTYDIFRAQENKRTSIIDCSNVVVMRKFNIPKVFSFDKFYPKAFKLSLVA